MWAKVSPKEFRIKDLQSRRAPGYFNWIVTKYCSCWGFSAKGLRGVILKSASTISGPVVRALRVVEELPNVLCLTVSSLEHLHNQFFSSALLCKGGTVDRWDWRVLSEEVRDQLEGVHGEPLPHDCQVLWYLLTRWIHRTPCFPRISWSASFLRLRDLANVW